MGYKCLHFFVAILTFLAGEAYGASSDEFSCEAGSSLSLPATNGLIRKVQEAYSSVSSLNAEFSQRSYLAALDLAEESSGKVTFKKPGKMKWVYEKPEEQIFTTLGHTVYFYQTAENQLLIDALTEVVLSDLPVAFLLGVGNLEAEFKLETSCAHRGGGTLLVLLPKKEAAKEDGAVGRFMLLVHSKEHYPLGAQVTDVGGNVTTISLSQIVLNKSVSDSEFEVKYPAGTDVIDRRKGEG